MDASRWTLTLLLLHLCCPADLAPQPTYTASPPPLQISPPVPPSVLPLAVLPTSSMPPLSTVSEDPMHRDHCTLTITPPTLVVRFGESAAANCSISQMGFTILGWEISAEDPSHTTEQSLVWSATNVTRWNITAKCYMTSDVERSPCHRILPVIVYQPPGGASLTVLGAEEGPLLEGHRYTLQCRVWDVAPIQNLLVTFYSGATELGRLRSNDTQKTPATTILSLDVEARREHNGAQFWCQAELQLGAQGPEEPLLVKSQNTTVEVHFGPELLCPRKLRLRAGQGLGCQAVGNPQPSLRWFRDGQEVVPPAALSAEHAGKYTINTTGGFGERNKTVEVEVLVPGSSSKCEGHFLLAALLIQILNLL